MNISLTNYPLHFNKKKSKNKKMMITTTEQLTELCVHLAQFPFVTLDTEFIREKTYYPQLCLIQIAGPNQEACIDPLASGIDLSPLFDLLQNKNVVKVFHAARQDVEIFYHLTGKIPVPLFDTQIAAMVCGYGDSVGYQQLVQDIAGISLDKSLRFTDWHRRPLTKEQIKYALNDVTHLRTIYQTFVKALAENGREAWLSEEIAVQNDPTTYDTDEENVWRKIKIPFKKPLQTHVFAKLCAWREKTAKKTDRPRKFILKDDALIELAILMPKDTEQMNRCRNLSNGFGKSAFGQEILKVIDSACSDPLEAYPVDWGKEKPLTQTQRTLVDLYHLLLMVISSELKVAPKIIAGTDELQQLARGNDDVPCMKGWRRDIFGEKAVLFKQGLLSFAYDPKTHQPVLQQQK